MTTPKVDIPKGTWLRSTFEFPELPHEAAKTTVEQTINNYTRRIRPERIVITTDVRMDARSTRVEIIGRTVRADGTLAARREHLIYDEGHSDRELFTVPDFALPFLEKVLDLTFESPLFVRSTSYESVAV